MDELVTSAALPPRALALGSLSFCPPALLRSAASLRQLLRLLLASAALQHQLQLRLCHLQPPPQVLNLCNALRHLQTQTTDDFFGCWSYEIRNLRNLRKSWWRYYIIYIIIIVL